MTTLPTPRAWLFGACIMATSAAVRQCGRWPPASPDVPLRPPSWVFGVVWPCLYVTTGVAWSLGGPALDPALLAVTGLCCAWLALYVCGNRRAESAVVLCCTTAVAWHASVAHGGTAGALLVPLAAWTAFASYLNVYDVALGASGCSAD